MKFASVVLGSIATIEAQATSEKCHAIAFSSGDESAAYQAGAFAGIVNSTLLEPEDYAYDSVSGISGGALNAVLLSSIEKGKEQSAATKME